MKVRTWFVIAVVFAIPISVAGQAPAARPTGPRSFDVRDFGAVGDGKSLDTGAIQHAIDACVQQGGGIVVVDHGNYLTGTIQLRSHVELHLTSTATLLGVGDLAKYRRDPKEVYKLLDRSLVYAEGCDQIAITGQGTINGQGKQFKNGNRDLRLCSSACAIVRMCVSRGSWLKAPRRLPSIPFIAGKCGSRGCGSRTGRSPTTTESTSTAARTF